MNLQSNPPRWWYLRRNSSPVTCLCSDSPFGSRIAPAGCQPKRVKIPCMNKSSALANWTPEQIALGKRWVETWRLAGEDLERIRRKEIRELAAGPE